MFFATAAVSLQHRSSDVLWRGYSPGRLKSLEAYTTVSLALAAMAASSSSLISTARLKLPASLVLNCGGLPYARSSRAIAADTRAPGVPFLAMSTSVLMASGACLRASSWMLWAAIRLGVPSPVARISPAAAMLELSSLRALKQRRDLLSGVKRPVSGSAHSAPTNDPTVHGEASAPSACSTQRRSSPATSPCPSTR